MKHLFFNALLIGTIAIAMAVSAHASVSYNLTGSGFTSPTTCLIIDSTDDLFALVYTTAGSSPNTVTTFPTNIAYGYITLECVSPCTTLSDTFGAFTIVVDVNDTSEGRVGQFTGNSAGGSVSATSSTLSILWAPSSLGGGSTNLDSGTFGANTFTIISPTLIPAPNSNGGNIAFTGQVSSTATPEPRTLLGLGLLGLGWRRAAKA